MVSPVHGDYRRCQAETPLIDLFKFAEPALNVHDVLPHMIERRTGDIIVTSSLAAHFPTPWEPVYASSKWAINCFVQTVRRQVFKYGIRVGSISPGPVISALLADWPPEKLKEAKESGSLLEASEVANVVTFI
jgi:ribitol 2-dehydrogenase